MSTRPTDPAAVARLSEAIAQDAMVLIELMEEIIGDGEPQSAANRLSAAVAMLARVGIMADRLTAAHGAMPYTTPAGWLLRCQQGVDAFDALPATTD